MQEVKASFFECDVPTGDGRCSDKACPCPEVRIPRGGGYLYIEPELVEFRREYPRLADANRAMKERIDRDFASKGVSSYITRFRVVPLLMCEQGARLRKLDLDVASADAKHWWATGLAPLRPTPLLSGRPQSQDSLSEAPSPSLAPGPEPSLNQEHYQRVLRVVLQSEPFRQTFVAAKGHVAAALSAAQNCSAFWKKEFNTQDGYGKGAGFVLVGAMLDNAFFADAPYSGSKLFNGADLRSAKLNRSIWLNMEIEHANFTRANLHEALMLHIWCNGAKFRESDLSGCEFYFVGAEDQTPIDFTNADLTNTTIHLREPLPAIFHGANMSGCRIKLDYNNDFQMKSSKKALDLLLNSLTQEQRSALVGVPGSAVASIGSTDEQSLWARIRKWFSH